MPEFMENILIMGLTVVILVAGGYLLLIILGWLLRIKSGGREQQGLTDLWIANQTEALKNKSHDSPSDDAE